MNKIRKFRVFIFPGDIENEFVMWQKLRIPRVFVRVLLPFRIWFVGTYLTYLTTTGRSLSILTPYFISISLSARYYYPYNTPKRNN